MECVFSRLVESIHVATQQRNYSLLYRTVASLMRELQTRTVTRGEMLRQVQGIDPVVQAILADVLATAGVLSSHVMALPTAVMDAVTLRFALTRLFRPVQCIEFPAFLLNAAYESGQAPRLMLPAAAAIYADVDKVQHTLHTILNVLDADRRN